MTRYIPKQTQPLRYNPVTGQPLTELNARWHHGTTKFEASVKIEQFRPLNAESSKPIINWRFNPWSGKERSNDQIEIDPWGERIVPPDELLFSQAQHLPSSHFRAKY